MKKIVIEIETFIPDDFDLDNERSELFDLEVDIKRKFEEITGYSVLNIYTKIEDI